MRGRIVDGDEIFGHLTGGVFHPLPHTSSGHCCQGTNPRNRGNFIEDLSLLLDKPESLELCLQYWKESMTGSLCCRTV